MKRIYKYELPTPDCRVAMPVDAEILTVQAFGPDVFVWAKVSSDAPYVHRQFSTLATGELVPETEMDYLGTVRVISGDVYHIHVGVLDRQQRRQLSMWEKIANGIKVANRPGTRIE